MIPTLAWFHDFDAGCLVTRVVDGRHDVEARIPAPCPSAASLSVAADGRWLVGFRSNGRWRAWEVKPGEAADELPTPPGETLYERGVPTVVAFVEAVGAPSAAGPMKGKARRYTLLDAAWVAGPESVATAAGPRIALSLVSDEARAAFTQTQPMVPTGAGWDVRPARAEEGAPAVKIGQPVVLAYEGVARLASGGLDVGPAYVLHLPMYRRCPAGWCELIPAGGTFSWDVRGGHLVANTAEGARLLDIEAGEGRFGGPGLIAFWPTPPPG